MNFFDDDFGLGPTSAYSKKQLPKGDTLSRKPAKKDDFDDLLDDLLTKEEKRSNKKKDTMQPYSSTYLDPPPNHMIDMKKTQKWSTPHIELDPYANSPKFPMAKHTSILDDRNSEDGRSYKSGFTGKQNTIEFDNIITLRGDFKEEIPNVQRSSRNMMKPPLRKKQSRQNLTKQPKQTSFWDDQPQMSFSRRVPEPTNLQAFPPKEGRGKSRQNNMSADLEINLNKVEDTTKIKQKIIQKEKIITVRQQATQLKKQFQNEVKQIKQSYQRQLKLSQQKLKAEVDENKQAKANIIKQYQQKLTQERTRWQNVLSENTQRLKEMHDWQIKKRTEAYQLQIQKIKSLSKFEDNIMKNQMHFNSNQDNIELKVKQRELNFEKTKLEQLRNHLEQRQKHLEYEQDRFHQYKKKQQEKLQYQKRLIYQKQSQIKKFQLQSKRNLALQKQRIASQIAQSQLENFRKKQALNLQREELRSLREMIEKEKESFEAFNTNILNDYKAKMRQVQAQKEQLNQMQIKIHKNLHLIELAEGKMRVTTNDKFYQRPSTASNNENHRNRSNTQLDNKLIQTKGRFKQMQNFAKKIHVQTQQQRQKVKQRVNLSGYITRINRALSKY